jgi:hypothetical protein
LAGKVTEKIVGSRNGAQTVAFSPSTSTRPYARPTRLKAGRSVRVRPREGPPSLLAVVSATGRFVRAATLHRCGQPIWAGREAPITARFTFWWSNDQDLDNAHRGGWPRQTAHQPVLSQGCRHRSSLESGFFRHEYPQPSSTSSKRAPQVIDD